MYLPLLDIGDGLSSGKKITRTLTESSNDNLVCKVALQKIYLFFEQREAAQKIWRVKEQSWDKLGS